MKLIKKATLFLFTIGIVFFLWSRFTVSSFDAQAILSSTQIQYPSKFNYKQVKTYCGPFSTAAVVRALAKKEVNSLDFAKTITWKIQDRGTHPIGLKKQLKKNGLRVETPRLRRYTNEQRIQFLQERLSQGKAVIILGEKNDYQHYFTVFGFNRTNKEFYVYDSWCKEGEPGLVIDENGEITGNKTMSEDELLDFWQNGGMHGFYNWFALVIGKP